MTKKHFYYINRNYFIDEFYRYADKVSNQLVEYFKKKPLKLNDIEEYYITKHHFQRDMSIIKCAHCILKKRNDEVRFDRTERELKRGIFYDNQKKKDS